MGTSKPCWIPRGSSEKIEPTFEGKIKPLKVIQRLGDGQGIMSILNDKQSEVDIFQATTRNRSSSKRGPKLKELPGDFIKKLSIEGLGAKAIATKLKNDEGIEISYKTVQRVLAGQRL